jgi:type I restriction enzyme, S subunit
VNLETFYENFELLAEAPNGVQKLRELILQLAVQGKLVPQDPNDEPACGTLERISKAKGNLSKREMWLDISAIPFNVPSSWAWVTLDECLMKLTDGTHNSPPNTGTGDYKYITAKNIKPEGIQLSNVTYVNAEIHREIYSRCNPEYGDILYIKDGATTGVVTINQLTEEFSMLSSVALLKPLPEINKRYLLYCLRSPFFYLSMRGNMSGVAITRVTLTKLNKALIPIAPLQEQKRIAAKVDQLMKFCDELEQSQQQKREARVRLNQSALDHMLAASASEEFNAHWQRICDNFDLLYDTPETIGKLRQSILQLAVEDKLVPQVSNDEPVIELLKRSIQERLALAVGQKDRERILGEFYLAGQKLEQENSNWLQLPALCLCDFITKGTTPASNELLPDGKIPYLKVYNIVNNKIDFFYKPTFISRKVHEKKLARSKIIPGDVLMNIVGPPLGKVAIVPNDFEEWNINQALAVFRPIESLNNRFLFYVLSCLATLESILKETKGTAGQDNLSLEQCRSIKIPLISIAKQKRIVAKVDQLMKLCDELETKLRQAQAISENLMASVVNHIFSTAQQSENANAALSA